MNKKILIIAIVIALVLGGLYFSRDGLLGGGAGQVAVSCETNTVTQATVGTTTSTILAASSYRAYARIQQPLNASSTITLSFDEGAAAVAGSGMELVAATTTLENFFVEFGLNTNYPYVGAVTGIVSDTQASLLVAGNASTTLLVTECRYR